MSDTTETKEEQLERSRNSNNIPDTDGEGTWDKYQGNCYFHLDQNCNCGRCRGLKQRIEITS